MNIFLFIISVLLDLFFGNIISISNSYLIPMFSIVYISFLSNYYSKLNKNKYYLIVLLFSIIYDCFFINNLFISILLFETIAFLNLLVNKKNSFILNILMTIVSIFTYDFLFYLLLVISKICNFNFNKLIFKISHSLLLNIIYIFLLFFVLKPKKA